MRHSTDFMKGRKLSRSKHTRNCHTLPRQITKEYPVTFIQLYRVKDGIGNLCGHCLVGVTTCVRTSLFVGRYQQRKFESNEW